MNREFWRRLSALDRRWIFLLVSLAVLVPILKPLPPPLLDVTPAVRGLYDRVSGLNARAPVLYSLDFDPASKPELYPMALAMLTHALRQDLRVAVVTLWVPGAGLAQDLLTKALTATGRQYGRDAVFLGWAPGASQVVIGLSQDLAKTFPRDHAGTPVGRIPALDGVSRLSQFSLVVDLAAGSPGVETWLIYGQGPAGKVPMAGGCTSVNAPGLYPYLQTGQLIGLVGGMKGGAEYEQLAGLKGGLATTGLTVLSGVQFLIILLVVLGNVAGWLSGEDRRRRRPRP